jgi:acetyl-CoA carboxylase alpha subunit
MKVDQDAHVQETISAIEDKIEAIIHSIRSERDGKIQRQIENVMERQEIPKEAAVHTMRAWQEETVACHETMAARLEYKEPMSKDMESEVECQKVPMKKAAVKSSRRTKKRHRSRHLAAGRRREPRELT